MDMKYFKHILIIFLVWRIFLFIPLYFSHIYLPFESRNKDAQLWAYTRPYKPVDNIFLFPWANFDGVHYLTIAGDSYHRGAEGRFFPLYPILISVITVIVGGHTIFGIQQFFTAFALANIFFLLSLIILYKLVRIDFSENIALWTVIFIALFPTSFFFGSIYSESIFLLLSLLSLYFARKQKFIYSGFFGFLLTLTRIVGIGIQIGLLYEFFLNVKNKTLSKNMLLQILPILFVPFGLIGFMYFNFIQWHDCFILFMRNKPWYQADLILYL